MPSKSALLLLMLLQWWWKEEEEGAFMVVDCCLLVSLGLVWVEAEVPVNLRRVRACFMYVLSRARYNVFARV